MPLFPAGKSTPTIPHQYTGSKHKGLGFLKGSADTATEDGRHGCRVYELNPVLQRQTFLGGISVDGTKERKKLLV
jgi:hypothetical protein